MVGVTALLLGVLAAALIAPPLASAAALRCHGLRATIVGTGRHDHLRGTPGPDVMKTSIGSATSGDPKDFSIGLAQELG
jgi:hypothetical protein